MTEGGSERSITLTVEELDDILDDVMPEDPGDDGPALQSAYVAGGKHTGYSFHHTILTRHLDDE